MYVHNNCWYVYEVWKLQYERKRPFFIKGSLSRENVNLDDKTKGANNARLT